MVSPIFYSVLPFFRRRHYNSYIKITVFSIALYICNKEVFSSFSVGRKVCIMLSIICAMFALIFGMWISYNSLEKQNKDFIGSSADRKILCPMFYLTVMTFWGFVYACTVMVLVKQFTLMLYFQCIVSAICISLVMFALLVPQHIKWKQKVRDFYVAKDTAKLQNIK